MIFIAVLVLFVIVVFLFNSSTNVNTAGCIKY